MLRSVSCRLKRVFFGEPDRFFFCKGRFISTVLASRGLSPVLETQQLRHATGDLRVNAYARYLPMQDGSV